MRIVKPPTRPVQQKAPIEPPPTKTTVFAAIDAEDNFALRYKMNKLFADRQFRLNRFLLAFALAIYNKSLQIQIQELFANLGFLIVISEERYSWTKKKKKLTKEEMLLLLCINEWIWSNEELAYILLFDTTT